MKKKKKKREEKITVSTFMIVRAIKRRRFETWHTKQRNKWQKIKDVLLNGWSPWDWNVTWDTHSNIYQKRSTQRIGCETKVCVCRHIFHLDQENFSRSLSVNLICAISEFFYGTRQSTLLHSIHTTTTNPNITFIYIYWHMEQKPEETRKLSRSLLFFCTNHLFIKILKTEKTAK